MDNHSRGIITITFHWKWSKNLYQTKNNLPNTLGEVPTAVLDYNSMSLAYYIKNMRTHNFGGFYRRAGQPFYVSPFSGLHQTHGDSRLIGEIQPPCWTTILCLSFLWITSNTRGLEINQGSSNCRASLQFYVSLLFGLHQTQEDSRLIGEVSTALQDYSSMSLFSLAYSRGLEINWGRSNRRTGPGIYNSLLSGIHQTQEDSRIIEEVSKFQLPCRTTILCLSSLWLTSNTRGLEISRGSSNHRAGLRLYVSLLSDLPETREDSRFIGEVSTVVLDQDSVSFFSLAYIKHMRTRD